MWRYAHPGFMRTPPPPSCGQPPLSLASCRHPVHTGRSIRRSIGDVPSATFICPPWGSTALRGVGRESVSVLLESTETLLTAAKVLDRSAIAFKK